jgi:hypothetical protein
MTLEAPTPSEDAAQKQEHPSAKDGEGDNNNQCRPSADFAALIDAIKTEASANRGEESREDRGKRFRDYLTLFFVMVTASGVLYQAYIFSGQLEEMKSAGVQTNKLIGANAKLAEAAGKQADAAQKQAQALVDSAKVAHDNMILAERAWVGPNNAAFSAEPAVGKPIDITITYQNTGRQPALNFVSSITAFPATAAEDANGTAAGAIMQYMTACKKQTTWRGGSVVYPSTGFSIYNLNTKTKDDLVDDAITKGDKVIFLQGCFLYRAFDAPRHSYFCYFYKHGFTKIQNLNICPSGHYAD